MAAETLSLTRTEPGRRAPSRSPREPWSIGVRLTPLLNTTHNLEALPELAELRAKRLRMARD